MRVRRFHCLSADCPRKVFAERLCGVAAAHTRRPSNLVGVQRHIDLALGGAAGVRLADRLALPVSGDTLLRLLRHGTSEHRQPAPTVIGINDWAWKRGIAHFRREEANTAIHRLAEAGTPIKEIVHRTGHSRKIVREVVRGGRADVFRIRMSSLDPFLPRLDADWAVGYCNSVELWRRLKVAGFRGALRVVTEWAARPHKTENAT